MSSRTDRQPPSALTRRPLLLAVVIVVVLGVGVAVATGLMGRAAAPTNPVPRTADSVARGHSIYLNNCAACHGADARGGGPLSGTTAVAPPALTGPSSHLAGHSDGDLFEFVHDGMSGGMPSWAGTLSDGDIWDIVNFLRSLDGR